MPDKALRNCLPQIMQYLVQVLEDQGAYVDRGIVDALLTELMRNLLAFARHHRTPRIRSPLDPSRTMQHPRAESRSGTEFHERQQLDLGTLSAQSRSVPSAT